MWVVYTHIVINNYNSVDNLSKCRHLTNTVNYKLTAIFRF